MNSVYYNENDPYPAKWLRNLIAAGLIPGGMVDERDIREVKAEDLKGFTQAHFFAGVGGWSYALQLAGWRTDEPVWTGSCPCQPLSCAGKRKGEMDERHLWPVWYELIAECRPSIVFGEQVTSGDGPEWIDGVSLDLEELGYAVGPGDLPAACVGAPDIRQRLWWVADAGQLSEGRQAELRGGIAAFGRQGQEQTTSQSSGHSLAGRLADADGSGQAGTTERSEDGGMDDATSNGTRREGTAQPEGHGPHDRIPREAGRELYWADYDLCWRRKPSGSGEWCRTQPGVFPLAPRVPGDVEQIKAYGNSIVAQVAAEFIAAYMEARA